MHAPNSSRRRTRLTHVEGEGVGFRLYLQFKPAISLHLLKLYFNQRQHRMFENYMRLGTVELEWIRMPGKRPVLRGLKERAGESPKVDTKVRGTN